MGGQSEDIDWDELLRDNAFEIKPLQQVEPKDENPMYAMKRPKEAHPLDVFFKRSTKKNLRKFKKHPIVIEKDATANDGSEICEWMKEKSCNS